MMEKQSVFSGKRHGFTLVELIVVIVVIAIIAAIAVPRITSFQDSARKARIQTEHRELVTAIQMYRANHPEAMPETVDFSKIAPYIAITDKAQWRQHCWLHWLKMIKVKRIKLIAQQGF